jgi:hypothetical protein
MQRVPVVEEADVADKFFKQLCGPLRICVLGVEVILNAEDAEIRRGPQRN